MLAYGSEGRNVDVSEDLDKPKQLKTSKDATASPIIRPEQYVLSVRHVCCNMARIALSDKCRHYMLVGSIKIA